MRKHDERQWSLARLRSQAERVRASAALSLWSGWCLREADRLEAMARSAERRAAQRERLQQRRAAQRERLQQRRAQGKAFAAAQRAAREEVQRRYHEQGDARVLRHAQELLGPLPERRRLLFAHVIDVSCMARIGSFRRLYAPPRPDDLQKPAILRARRSVHRHAMALAIRAGFSDLDIARALRVERATVRAAHANVAQKAPDMHESLWRNLRMYRMAEDTAVARSVAEAEREAIRARNFTRARGQRMYIQVRPRWESEMDRGWTRLSTPGVEDDVIARLDLARAAALLSDDELYLLRRIAGADDAAIRGRFKLARTGDYDASAEGRLLTKLTALRGVLDAMGECPS